MQSKLELVTRLIVITQAVVAPSRCSHCDADFSDSRSVRMECFTESDVDGFFSGGGTLEHEDEELPDEAGRFLPYRYACGRCGSVFAESRSDRLRYGNAAADPLRELRGRFSDDLDLLRRIDHALEASAIRE